MAEHAGPRPNKNRTLKKNFFIGDYLHPKNLKHWLIPAKEIDNKKILQSDSMKAYFSHNLKLSVSNAHKNTFVLLHAMLSLCKKI